MSKKEQIAELQRQIEQLQREIRVLHDLDDRKQERLLALEQGRRSDVEDESEEDEARSGEGDDTKWYIVCYPKCSADPVLFYVSLWHRKTSLISDAFPGWNSDIAVAGFWYVYTDATSAAGHLDSPSDKYHPPVVKSSGVVKELLASQKQKQPVQQKSWVIRCRSKSGGRVKYLMGDGEWTLCKRFASRFSDNAIEDLLYSCKAPKNYRTAECVEC